MTVTFLLYLILFGLVFQKENAPVYLAVLLICGILVALCIFTDALILYIVTCVLMPVLCMLPKLMQKVQSQVMATETERGVPQLTNDRPVYNAPLFSAPNAPLAGLRVSEGQRATNLGGRHHHPTADLPPPVTDTEGRITQLTNDRPVYNPTFFSAPSTPFEELSASGLESQHATTLGEHQHLPTADLPPPYFALENEATDPSQGPPASLYVIRPPIVEPPSYQEAVQM